MGVFIRSKRILKAASWALNYFAFEPAAELPAAFEPPAAELPAAFEPAAAELPAAFDAAAAELPPRDVPAVVLAPPAVLSNNAVFIGSIKEINNIDEFQLLNNTNQQ